MIKTIHDINTDQDYGKLLFAAITLLAEAKADKKPDEVLEQVTELSSVIFSNKSVQFETMYFDFNK